MRYWDGSAWTEHTAWATGAPGATAATAAAAAAAAPAAAPGQPASEHGHFLGALPRTVGKGGRMDVLVYERALVFARVPGVDPAMLGFLLGWVTVSAIVGYIAGDYYGASKNAARIAGLSYLSPEQIAATDKRNAIVPVSSITEADLITSGKAGGRMKLRTSSGKAYKRRWTRPHTKDVNAEWLLGAAFGNRFTIKRGSALRPYLALILLLALVAAMLVAIALPTFFKARERAEERAAVREITPACRALVQLNTRAAQGEPVDPQEITTVMGNLVGPMNKAADRDGDFAEARDSTVRASAFLSAWDGASTPPETLENDVDTALTMCVAVTT